MIPLPIRKELSEDPFMDYCCISGDMFPDWHHVWKYGGKQINEVWAIVPLAYRYHVSEKYAVHKGCKRTKELVELVSLLRLGNLAIAVSKYPKFDWVGRYNYLKHKYGKKKYGKIWKIQREMEGRKVL